MDPAPMPEGLWLILSGFGLGLKGLGFRFHYGLLDPKDPY